MRLLLVEDDVAIQGFLKRALSEAGYQVDTAHDARSGELKALEGIHDALIIDLGLPDMDGLNLIARCRAQGSSAPVLILSARRSVVRLEASDLQLDLVRHEARRGDHLLQLTPQEFSLLEYLCRNAGRVVTRTMILDHVWRMRIDPATNVVDVHIYRLRNKVDPDGRTPLIHTIRGVGYMLKNA